jgi:repressor LexA
MQPLTARQQDVLHVIQSAITQTGMPPTRAEIAQQLGFSSPNAAETHIKALIRKGALEHIAGASRGIRPVSTGQDLLQLPVIGRVAAGSPLLATAHIIKHYTIDPNFFKQVPDYLLQVRGMSMRDAGILDGDLLAVKKSTYAQAKQIIVARLGDEVTVKRYLPYNGGIILGAEHPAYPHIDVNMTKENFAIEGIAVGLLRIGTL